MDGEGRKQAFPAGLFVLLVPRLSQNMALADNRGGAQVTDIIKYEVANYGYRPRITRVTCSKETDKSVWIGEKRRPKMSMYNSYFNTFSDAKEFLLGKADSKIKSVRTSLSLAESHYVNVKGMKE